MSSRTAAILAGADARQAVPVVVGRRGVLQSVVGGQIDADLVGGGRYETLRLDLLPRRIESLGTDATEHVALTAVLAHERGGEADAAPRLQISGELEYGGGKQMHLVIDDEAPVQSIQQREVRVLALPLRRQDLVGGDRDRLDFFGLAGVLADLLGGERGALEQLVAPFAGARRCG